MSSTSSVNHHFPLDSEDRLKLKKFPLRSFFLLMVLGVIGWSWGGQRIYCLDGFSSEEQNKNKDFQLNLQTLPTKLKQQINQVKNTLIVYKDKEEYDQFCLSFFKTLDNSKFFLFNHKENERFLKSCLELQRLTVDCPLLFLMFGVKFLDILLKLKTKENLNNKFFEAVMSFMETIIAQNLDTINTVNNFYNLLDNVFVIVDEPQIDIFIFQLMELIIVITTQNLKKNINNDIDNLSLFVNNFSDSLIKINKDNQQLNKIIQNCLEEFTNSVSKSMENLIKDRKAKDDLFQKKLEDFCYGIAFFNEILIDENGLFGYLIHNFFSFLVLEEKKEDNEELIIFQDIIYIFKEIKNNNFDTLKEHFINFIFCFFSFFNKIKKLHLDNKKEFYQTFNQLVRNINLKDIQVLSDLFYCANNILLKNSNNEQRFLQYFVFKINKISTQKYYIEQQLQDFLKTINTLNKSKDTDELNILLDRESDFINLALQTKIRDDLINELNRLIKEIQSLGSGGSIDISKDYHTINLKEIRQYINEIKNNLEPNEKNLFFDSVIKVINQIKEYKNNKMSISVGFDKNDSFIVLNSDNALELVWLNQNLIDLSENFYFFLFYINKILKNKLITKAKWKENFINSSHNLIKTIFNYDQYILCEKGKQTNISIFLSLLYMVNENISEKKLSTEDPNQLIEKYINFMDYLSKIEIEQFSIQLDKYLNHIETINQKPENISKIIEYLDTITNQQIKQPAIHIELELDVDQMGVGGKGASIAGPLGKQPSLSPKSSPKLPQIPARPVPIVPPKQSSPPKSQQSMAGQGGMKPSSSINSQQKKPSGQDIPPISPHIPSSSQHIPQPLSSPPKSQPLIPGPGGISSQKSSQKLPQIPGSSGLITIPSSTSQAPIVQQQTVILPQHIPQLPSPNLPQIPGSSGLITIPQQKQQLSKAPLPIVPQKIGIPSSPLNQNPGKISPETKKNLKDPTPLEIQTKSYGSIFIVIPFFSAVFIALYRKYKPVQKKTDEILANLAQYEFIKKTTFFLNKSMDSSRTFVNYFSALFPRRQSKQQRIQQQPKNNNSQYNNSPNNKSIRY